MGWRQTSVVTNLVVIEGASGGLFVYSPRPGPGNLIASIAAASGANDGFGNPFQAGFTVYSASGFTQMLTNALIFRLVGDVFDGGLTPTAAGGPSGVPGVIVSSVSNFNAAGGNSQAFIGLAGQSADGTKGPFIYLGSGQVGSSNIQPAPVLIVGGGLAYAAPGVPGGSLVPETFHNFTITLAGWANTNAFVMQYRLLPTQDVEIVGDISGTALGAGSQIVGVLPAGYRPTAGSAALPITVQAGTLASGQGTPSCFLDTLGEFKVQNVQGATRLSFYAVFPLTAT